MGCCIYTVCGGMLQESENVQLNKQCGLLSLTPPALHQTAARDQPNGLQ